ncbi:MAG: hypothetical protein ABIO40_03270 [Devosia sp.]
MAVEPARSIAVPVAPMRVSDLKPVSENRSFGEAPTPVILRPVAPEPTPSALDDGGFKFDFGLDRQPDQKPANDPIADLIAAELGTDDGAGRAPEPPPPPVRNLISSVPALAKPTLSPLAASAAARPATNAPIPLKPMISAPRPIENDRFAVSPSMGMPRNGSYQALNPQPLPPIEEPEAEESDPMAEIESLIGDAVRVELAPPGPVRVQEPIAFRAEPKFVPPLPPVVPPLNNQFAPRRTTIAEPDGDAAEEAIIAASADSGIDIGRLDGPSVTDESPYRRLKVKPQRQSFLSGGMRQYVGMAIAGTLLLAAGLGLYWVLNMGRGASADAPVLTADATPVKVAPTPEVAAEDEVARSPVLDQLDGPTAEPVAEQLVSTDETGGQDVARVVGDEAATPPTDEATEGGLANRKVRTVTVRPDGTIVPGDDAVAGAEELPVDRPNVPEVPGADADEIDLLGDEPVAADPGFTGIDATDPAPLLAETPTAIAAPDPAAKIAAAGGFLDPTKVAPTPAPSPNRDAILAAYQAVPETPRPLAAFADSAEPIVTAPVTNGRAAAYVQLTSSPSQDDASVQARSQTARFGSLFGGNALIVQQADLGQKGIWYRVLLPVSSLAEANRICADIKANGGECITKGA